MSSTSELSSFAACLRESIRTSDWGARMPAEAAPSPSTADFAALSLRLFALQFERNSAYRRLCQARGMRPETVTDWADIPAAPTAAFKELELTCLPAGERKAVFHSSGTTGQSPSRHYHNAESLALYEASLLRWFGANIQLPIADSQLVMLTPPPSQAPHSSLVQMFDTILREAGQGRVAFVGRVAGEGIWTLDAEAALERLRAASGAGERVMLLGTAYSFVHLLDYLAEQDMRLELPPGSRALETGGYKGRSRSLLKAALHALITERLGIPPARILCEYGMSELSSQAYDSAILPAGHAPHAPRSALRPLRPFLFPPWARVQIVSPETGAEVAEGETGLIRVFDLANVYSVMAVQTEDLGIRHGDGFALAGRAVLAEPRGCSLMAL